MAMPCFQSDVKYNRSNVEKSVFMYIRHWCIKEDKHLNSKSILMIVIHTDENSH